MANEAVLAPGYDAQSLEVKRRRALAKMLMDGAEMPQGQMVSGHYVAPSPLHGLNSLVRTYLGAKEERGADEQEAGMREKNFAALVRALKGEEFDPREVSMEQYLPILVSQQEAEREAADEQAKRDFEWQKHQTPSGSTQYTTDAANQRHLTPSGSTMYSTDAANQRHLIPSGSSLAHGGALVDAARIQAAAQMKEYGKETGAAQAETIDNAIKQIPRAQGIIDRADMVDKAIDEAGYMGPGAKTFTDIKKLGAEMGLNKPPTAENLVDFVNKEWVASMQFDEGGNRVLAGQMSDSDRKFFEERAVGLADDRQAAKIKSEIMRRTAKRQLEVGKLAQKYRSNPQGFDEAVRQLDQSNNVFDEKLKNQINNAIGAKRDGGGVKFLGFE